MIAFLSLAVLVTVVTLALGWRKNPVEISTWDLRTVSLNFTVITVTLAGFAVASVVLLPEAKSAQDPRVFMVAAGILMLAYLTLTGAAMIFGANAYVHVENRPELAELERVSYCLAVIMFMQGLSLSWIAVRPLLLLFNLPELSDLFSWVLVAAVLAGSVRPGVPLQQLLGVRRWVTFLVPVLGFVAAAAYWLARPDSLASAPEVPQALLFGVTLFVLALAGFVFHSLLHAFLGTEGMEGVRRANGHRILLAYYQLTVLTVALLLLTVAFP